MKDFVRIDTKTNRIELLDARFYEHNGEFYPSVTTILEAYPKSAAFYDWLKKVGQDADSIRDEFGRRGSTVHRLTEEYDNGIEVSLLSGGRPQYSSAEWSMFEKYVDFSTRFSPKILEIELNLVSPELGFGGTLDRVIILNGKKLLIDIKTSNAVHNHYWLQLAAYVKLYGEVDGVAILWLNSKHRSEGKKGDVQGMGWKLEFPEKSIEEYWHLFQSTQSLWNMEAYKPRNIFYKLKHQKNGL